MSAGVGAMEKMSQIHFFTRNAPKSIRSFIQQLLMEVLGDIKSFLTSRCLCKLILSPSCLNKAPCVWWNDMGQLILNQTHLALQCPPGTATQTNYFQQRINTGECCGPRAEMAFGGGISSK